MQQISTDNHDLRKQLELTTNTAKMLVSDNRLLEEIGTSLGYLHSKLNAIMIQQYSIEGKLTDSKLGKDTKESLERLMKFTIKIHQDVIEGLYTTELTVQSYLADLDIIRLASDFVDVHAEDETEEEAGNELNIQLFDFTNGNTPEVSELDY